MFLFLSFSHRWGHPGHRKADSRRQLTSQSRLLWTPLVRDVDDVAVRSGSEVTNTGLLVGVEETQSVSLLVDPGVWTHPHLQGGTSGRTVYRVPLL